MILLDENIVAQQVQLLRGRGIRARQIGIDLGRSGMDDEAVIALLHKQRGLTFFTRDLGFYRRGWCHKRYGLVCLQVSKDQVAHYTYQVLRHPELNTKAKRLGRVIRVIPSGLWYWELGGQREFNLPWAV